MKKALAILGLLAILMALVPLAAEAGGRGGWHRGGGRVFVGVGVGFPCCGFYPWPYYSPYYYPAYYSAPTVVYTSPAPAPTYTQPQAPQVEREVVFAEGRYLLQGDGVSTAYKWVWVPNPPAPPPGPPPSAPPTATPQPR
jgi:hypothetical protein